MVGPFRVQKLPAALLLDSLRQVLILWLLPLYSTNSMRLYPRYLCYLLPFCCYVTLCESIHDVSCPKHSIARPGNWEKRGVVCIGLNLDAAPSLQVIFLVFIV